MGVNAKSPWLTPYYSYRAQEICPASHLKISPERPAAGNTCVSMENLRILGPKSHQTDEFWDEFSKMFPEPLGI